MNLRRHLAPLLFALAGCSEPAGLRVDLDLAGFESMIATLRITVSATPGGFAMPAGSTPAGVAASTQEDGANGQKLVVDFTAPIFKFGSSLSFRVTRGNQDPAAVNVTAVASNPSVEIAEASQASQTLPGGGHTTVSLKLQAHMGSVPPNTIDLAATAPDVIVQGGQQNAALSAVALCDFDGDGKQDLVIGAPGAEPPLSIGATGAVYVIFGPFAGGASFNLMDTSTLTNELHIFGANGGDRLGTSVACADIDKNGADDLIIGAPNAGAGGIVYVALGTRNRRTTSIKLMAPNLMPADIEWDGPAGATLGSAVFAANVDADGAAEVLVAAAGASQVHLFSGGTNGQSWPKGKFTLDGTEPAHVIFTGAAAAALGAGDFNSSGTDPVFPLDVVLGDPSYQSMMANQAEGIVYVFGEVTPVAPVTGPSQTIDAAAAKLAVVGTEGSQFGTAVLAADLTARGQDLFVGAPGESAGNGAVRIFTHDTSLFRNRTPSSTGRLTGLVAGERFGGALAADPAATRLYVGASAANRSAKTGAGAAYVFRGDTSLVEQILGADAGGRLGASVAAGLIDGGDSKSDLLTVAPGAMGAEVGSGVAYVRFGR